MRVVVVVIGMLLALAGEAGAQLDRLLEELLKAPGGVVTRGGLTDVKMGEGLKEALRVGTENTVNLTGRLDGFFANEAIKILMPPKLRTLERGLRVIGYGPQVDEFVLGMNRAAERAAPFAKGIFWDAIGEMTFADVGRVFNGGQTAATEYFREKTTDRLAEAFRPVVDRAMNEVGVTRQYKELIAYTTLIPLFKAEAFDLDRYVVSRGLDGLFHVLAEQERQIRTNPAARVTDLLKEVFGR